MKKQDLEALKTLAVSTPLKPALDDDTNYSKIKKFIMIFNIKEGKNKVNVTLLYKVYADWAEKPMAKRPFYTEFAKFHLSKVKHQKTYYELNIKPGGLVKKGQELTDLRNNIE